MNVSDIKTNISSGNFDILVGKVEDEHLEAKSGKYDLSTDSGKLELVKDVSSFANKTGGLIIIGAQTSPDPAYLGRRIQSISPFEFDLINPTDYQNVIKEWIFPKLENIEIEWASSQSDVSLGVLFIFIPNQPEHLRPFLIKKDVDPLTNRRRKEILFGYVERFSHSSDPASVQTIHTMLRFGRENERIQSLESRISALEGQRARPVEDAERKGNLEILIPTRTQLAIKEVNLDTLPYYSIVTAPVENTEVQTILRSTEDSITRLLENPPTLRYAGWALDTEDTARLIGGELRRVKVDQYKILDLYRDGTLVFVCTADESLLGWGNNFGKGRINPLALIEITYMYFHFYSEVIQRFSFTATTLQVAITLANLVSDDVTFTLAPYSVDAISQRLSRRHLAPENTLSFTFPVPLQSYNPGTAAFAALREIYGWFGIEADKIPYLTADRCAVDVEKLKNPKSENS